jgi:alpha-glucoside transport system permease protein
MTDQQTRPAPAPVVPSPPGARSGPRRGLSVTAIVVWVVILAVIVALIWASWKPRGSGYLYNAQNQHGWFVNAIFNPQSWGQKLLVMVIAILLFVAIMAVILWVIDRPRVPNGVVIAGFLGPVVIALTVGLLWSAVKTIIQSFQKFDSAGNATGWTGFANYGKVFTSNNTAMLVNTVLWIFLVPILATVVGLVYAVLVDRTRFEAGAKALIFLPTAISMVAASVIWRYVYYQPSAGNRPQVGLLNALWNVVGGTPQNWITKYPTATFALIVVMIWIQAGFAMTVLSAAIKAVPDDIIEAARIDGATGMRLFWSVTIPTIRPTMVVVLTTVAIASLKTFDIVNVMGGNLPKNNILANAFYNASAVQQNGLAGAYAVLIFIVVTPVIIFNVRQMRKADSIR